MFARSVPSRVYVGRIASRASFHSSTNLSALKTLGIRREDAKRRWERRAPLTPEHVGQLVSQGAKVLVQPCEKRIFADGEYEQVGAEVKESLGDADVVIGIKEIPGEELESGKTYAFFSHTHKGQSYNVPLLESMLASGSRFIDWELLTDDAGKRTAAFGYLAGFAGMADGLSQFATKALALGSATPFLQLPRPYMSRSVTHLRHSLQQVGEEIRRRGTPRMLGPIVISVVGSGRVGEGAKSVLDEMGIKWVRPEELDKLVHSPNPDLHTIYGCHVSLADYLSNKDGSPFDREEYRSHPERFFSEFGTKIAPYTTIMLNGGFWDATSPRVLTTSELESVRKLSPPNKFLAVVDVSCDFGGGLEFVTKPTTIDKPTLQMRVDECGETCFEDPATPNTTQISSIEILPSELPLDSSLHFSSSILPYVTSLLLDPASSQPKLSARALKRATIVDEGRLAPAHKDLYSLLGTLAPARRKRALVLGSGLVASPAVEILASRSDIDVTIASNELGVAQKLAAGRERIAVAHLDATDTATLKKLIADSDVVLSLLPAPLHVEVAELCIANGSHLVTASYVSPAMLALHELAKESGVILLNELGLDPGIDHCSAMRLIADATERGNKIVSFVSFCGGLPALEDSHGPLRYKFSWSPRGVLTAALNDAHFRINSTNVHVPGEDLLRLHFPRVPFLDGFDFEGVANRNSINYLKEYGLPEDLPTILRGTLRYPGFSSLVNVFKKIGLLSQTALPKPLVRWSDLTDMCLTAGGFTISSEAARREALLKLADGNKAVCQEVIETLQGLFLVPSSAKISHELPIDVPSTAMTPLDLLSILLGGQLRYEAGERDAVFLHHELGTVSSSGTTELFTSTLVQYGAPEGDSAMATTVGMPIALGALLCLDGKIPTRGIVSPSQEAVWRPLLAMLQARGIDLVEDRVIDSRGLLDQLEAQFANAWI